MDYINGKDEVIVGLMTLKTGGVGLNLQGANHMVFLNHQYNPAWTTQAIHRIYRNGQHKNCFIYRLVYMRSIDQEVFKLGMLKHASAACVLDCGKG